MPDKLTDKEIVKALKEILELMLCEGDLQRSATIRNTLDLINRQNAEIDDLKTENLILSQKRFNIFERIEYTEKLKNNAYKEFAERFKKKLSRKYTTSLWKVYCEEIDTILKKLVGEDNVD